MQHRGMFVEADDVAVGQLVGILAHGAAIGHVDGEFTLAFAERGFGGAMAAHRQVLRFAHQRNLVRRLVAALVFQIVDHGVRVVGRVLSQRALGFAQDRAARGGLGQQGQCFLGLADDVDVEMLHPPAAGRVRHHVPVVEGLVEDHPGPLARRVHQPAVGHARQR